jgi:hypothetical protein
MTEPGLFLMMALVVAHVLSVHMITRSQEKIVEECRKVVLEREETERYYYAHGPGAKPEEPQSLEVI